MRLLIESAYWIGVFLSPNFAALLVIALLYSIYDYFSYWYLLLFLPSIIIGFLLAERARKKYGASNYYAKPSNTPDIVETWERNNNNQKSKND